MSLKPRRIPPLPDETRRVAYAIFPQGALLLRLQDALETLYDDPLFADLFPTHGQPAEEPWRLALVTVFQFMEDLSDRQAAHAARTRIDWKYALRLELTDPGFDFSVLSEFRTRLLRGQAEQRLLTRLLEVAMAHGWVRARGRQRTDSTHILAAVRILNRLELVGETLRHALNVLADVAPDWLRAWVPPEWYDRYSQRIEDYRLPATKEARDAYALVVGAEDQRLLAQVAQAVNRPWLGELPALQALRAVWEQQYQHDPSSHPRDQGREEEGAAQTAPPVNAVAVKAHAGATEAADAPLRWRTAEELPLPGERWESPYDPEARFASKRALVWRGYKVHVTESCDPDRPHLITDVQTTPAPLPDVSMTQPIEQALVERDVPPREHFVDAGYTEVGWLVDSARQVGITVVGPVRANGAWQARSCRQGHPTYDVTQFQLDWQRHEAICPQGQRSRSWTPYHDRAGNPVISVKFARPVCRQCLVRAHCTRSARQARQLSVRVEADYAALERLRAEQATPAWQARYHQRAGVEGTFAQGVRCLGLRQTRYIGLAKTPLQQIASAVALNFVRLANWLVGVPFATTRRSRFARLAQAG
jgi:transposase